MKTSNKIILISLAALGGLVLVAAIVSHARTWARWSAGTDKKTA